MRISVTSGFLMRLEPVKYVATDFDGVHTDGRVLVGDDGRESVFCDRRDGLAYDALREAEIGACIISKETNPVVAQRAKKLQIACRQSVATGDAKLQTLMTIAVEQGLQPEQFLYIGDDINDLAALGWAGAAVCPADAHGDVCKLVRRRNGYISLRRGGAGVIREAVELLFAAQGRRFKF